MVEDDVAGPLTVSLNYYEKTFQISLARNATGRDLCAASAQAIPSLSSRRWEIWVFISGQEPRALDDSEAISLLLATDPGTRFLLRPRVHNII